MSHFSVSLFVAGLPGSVQRVRRNLLVFLPSGVHVAHPNGVTERRDDAIGRERNREP